MLAPSNPFQPATMLWRVFEIEAVQRHVELRGRGCDIGCGDGTLAATVFSVYDPRPTIVGVEPDPADCAAARASGTYISTHCVRGDAIPEPDGAFDFVFSNSTLEHIPGLDRVLREAARVLRPDGVFVFTVPSDEFHACLRGSGTTRAPCPRPRPQLRRAHRSAPATSSVSHTGRVVRDAPSGGIHHGALRAVLPA
jgi:SAM-dependent methyltransferase